MIKAAKVKEAMRDRRRADVAPDRDGTGRRQRGSRDAARARRAGGQSERLPTLLPWLDYQLRRRNAQTDRLDRDSAELGTAELYDDYAAKLAAVGLSPVRQNNTVADPNVGPNVVTGVSPATRNTGHDRL